MISTIFWNLRGIANTSTLSRIRQLISNNHVIFLAVIEPMVDNSQLAFFILQLGFAHACSNINSKIWPF